MYQRGRGSEWCRCLGPAVRQKNQVAKQSVFCDPLAGLKAEPALHIHYRVWRLDALVLRVLLDG